MCAYFFPRFDENIEPNGSWVVLRDDINGFTYYFDALEEKDFQIRNDFINAGYKKIQGHDATYGYMIFSKLSDKQLAIEVSYETTLEILMKNERTLMNMVPY